MGFLGAFVVGKIGGALAAKKLQTLRWKFQSSEKHL